MENLPKWESTALCCVPTRYKHIKISRTELSLDSVTKYDKKTANLTLEHNYPVGNLIRAAVNINLVLATVKSHETQIGEWINVIGYVETDQQNLPKDCKETNCEIPVQALVLWSSGPLNLERYESSLEAQKKASVS